MWHTNYFLVYHYTFDNIYVCEWTLFLWQGMSTKKIMAHIFINNLKYSVGNFFWKKNVSRWISMCISLQFSNVIGLVVYNSYAKLNAVYIIVLYYIWIFNIKEVNFDQIIKQLSKCTIQQQSIILQIRVESSQLEFTFVYFCKFM